MPKTMPNRLIDIARLRAKTKRRASCRAMKLKVGSVVYLTIESTRALFTL